MFESEGCEAAVNRKGRAHVFTSSSLEAGRMLCPVNLCCTGRASHPCLFLPWAWLVLGVGQQNRKCPGSEGLQLKYLCFALYSGNASQNQLSLVTSLNSWKAPDLKVLTVLALPCLHEEKSGYSWPPWQKPQWFYGTGDG